MKNNILKRFIIGFWVVSAGFVYGQDYSVNPLGEVDNILPLWQQAKIMEKQLRIRKQTVVPEVMRREGVDMWLVSRDEYVLYLSLVTANDEGLVARRPDPLIFYDRGNEDGVEVLVEEFERVADLINSRDPQKIAVSKETKERLENKVGAQVSSRLVSSRKMRTAFLQIRSDEEMSIFEHVVRVSHEIIAEAYSNRTIIPDVTTTDELNWWIRQRYRDIRAGMGRPGCSNRA